MRLAIIHNLPISLTHKKDAIADEEVLVTANAIKIGLGGTVDIFKFSEDIIETLKSYDLVFNLAESNQGSSYSEDEVAQILEKNNINFTGADSKTLTLTIDKMIIKKILIKRDILTPKYEILSKVADTKLSFPLMVKPSREHGSIGIDKNSVVYNNSELKLKLKDIFKKYSQPALVEEYIEGREINAAILEEEVLPLSEIVFNLPNGEPNILTYDAKWLLGSAEYDGTVGKCPTELDSVVEKKIKSIALEVFKEFGCRDYARVDFRLKDNVPYVIDVNPNPCINPDGAGFIRASKAAGYDYVSTMKKIISSAMKRNINNIQLEILH